MHREEAADALRLTPAYALCDAIVRLLIALWPSRAAATAAAADQHAAAARPATR